MAADLEKKLHLGVKKKGIGPKGSKQVSIELLKSAISALNHSELSLTMRATFWTACLTLKPSEEEKKLFEPFITNPTKKLPLELASLLVEGLFDPQKELFLSFVRKVIKNQNLTLQEIAQGMDFLWDEELPEWIKASFLQGLRVKRESFQENSIAFEKMWKKSRRLKVNIPILVDLCDSYDGSNRSYHLGAFIAATLAAMNIPTVIHGVSSLAPKFGITTAQILSICKKNTELSLEQAKEQILDSKIGWAYVDQKIFFPELYNIRKVRKEMVKRPLLATFEKFLQPIQSKYGNCIFSGYVHSPYRERLVKIMSLYSLCNQFFIMRSIEGSTNCSLNKKTLYLGYQMKKPQNVSLSSLKPLNSMEETSAKEFLNIQKLVYLEGQLDPTLFPLIHKSYPLMREITAEQIKKDGIAALKGEKNICYSLIQYHVCSFINLIQKNTEKNNKDSLNVFKQVESVLNSGKAWDHFLHHA